VSKKFAVFDIDGTIVRWQLYHAIGDAMAKAGIIDSKLFDQVRASRMNWKTRQNYDSFSKYEIELVKVFDYAIKGLEVGVFEDVITNVFEEYKEQVYTYTRDLIAKLKAQDYLLFALSGSPQQIVGMIAEYYGFDDFVGTSYGIKNSRFTGKKNLLLGQKGELLNQLVRKHQAGAASSIGVGDTEGDIDMLTKVETAVAFNPTKQLFSKARAENWTVVIERKNMVYTLEPSQTGYILKGI